MRIAVDGVLGTGVTPKDLIMAVIREIGADGAAGIRHRVRRLGDSTR